ncbi:FAD-binding oxidoreductase [Pseudodonghicola flavimaris]|uniref:FAD-binding oxidoreductase n=1 Tax=Pseudodonghicola flavimaris TaxID=3050036 RepID=A0ABT7F3N4_9RHOB|nr:FAD-binding oxidoreductase [Pseudodonghicola flavimaris]MDK3019200.1 FAD-binding oxidoreductase [Pseudodonghicola flavimaris]
MIVERLIDRLGSDLVSPGPQSDPRFHRDWTARSPVVPLAVVQPRRVEDVSAALALCDEAGVPVVPQGGLTGLVGGAMPGAETVVVNMSRMNATPDIDPIERQARVEAGVTLEALQRAAAVHELEFPVDFGARGSCQIGGMIATNAGGVHVLQHGMMRRQVVGIEAVLADGTIVSAMNALEKNNTGYDLRQVLTGSEGTLAVITAAKLRLVPRPPARAAVLMQCENLHQAYRVFDGLRDSSLLTLHAFEGLWPGYYDFACGITAKAPFAASNRLTLLAEVVGDEREVLEDALLEVLGRQCEDGTLSDALFSQSEAQVDAFWALREANEALATSFGAIVAFDVSLPRARMDGFVERARTRVSELAPAADFLCFGHLGDGNLHIAIAAQKALPDPGAIKDGILRLVLDCDGAISAEHGIGLEKKAWLSRARSSGEVEMMQRLKTALDRRNILNRGKLFPDQRPAATRG